MKIRIDDQYYSDGNEFKNYCCQYKEVDIAEDNSVKFYRKENEPIYHNEENKSPKVEKNIIYDTYNVINEEIKKDESISTKEPIETEFYEITEEEEAEDIENVVQNEDKGQIEVIVKLGTRDGVVLKGAKINLYMLNGVSPKLIESKVTDSLGKISFNNLEEGCYRVISIVDRKFFEKPHYYNWNEVNIDKYNKKSSICVVNKIKVNYYNKKR